MQIVLHKIKLYENNEVINIPQRHKKHKGKII